jgi:hypothetical protein
MTGWHNKFGEEGQRLTILSVLPRTPSPQPQQPTGAERTRDWAIDELFEVIGRHEREGAAARDPLRAGYGRLRRTSLAALHSVRGAAIHHLFAS